MNIKRIAASFVAVVVAASSLVIASFAATIGVADGILDEETGLLYVPLDNGTLKVTYPDDAEPTGDIVIPETFGEGENAKTVTVVDNRLIVTASHITSISIPKTIEELGRGGSYTLKSELQSITVAEDNPEFSSEDGVLFDKNKTLLYKYPPKKAGSSYTVPSTVTEIHMAGFAGSEIASVVLPNGLERIDDIIFANCRNLTEVAFPGSIEDIGVALFHDSGVSKVTVDSSNTNYCVVDNVMFTADKKTLVAYPPAITAEKYSVPEGTEVLLKYAFNYTPNLKEIEIPESVKDISRAFAGVSNVTSIKIPNGVTYIGRQCFMLCRALETIDIPVTVTEILEEAFRSCDALKVINYGGTQEDWDKIVIEAGNEALNNATINFSDGTTGGTELSDVVQEPDVTVNDDGTKDFTPGVKKNITTTDADIETMKNIKANAPADAFAEDVVLKVSHDTFTGDRSSFAVDISFEKGDGTKVQPAKPVTVKIPVPESLKNKDPLFVYHINENGKAEKVEAETETIDGVKYMVFEASSFSTYVLSAESELDKENEPSKDEPVIEPLPDTPDTSDTTSAPSESSPSDTANSNTTSSDNTSSDNTSSEPVSSDSSVSEPTAADTSSSAAPSTPSASEGNPGTGIALSFIPLIAAVSAVLVIKKRK